MSRPSHPTAAGRFASRASGRTERVRPLRVYRQRDAETPGQCEGWKDALLERDGHPFAKLDPDLAA